MKFQFTGVGLILGSIFGMGAWFAIGQRAEVTPIIGTLGFFVGMAFAFSQINIYPRITLIVAMLGMIFGIGMYIATKNFGIALFFFACMTTAFSFPFQLASVKKNE